MVNGKPHSYYRRTHGPDGDFHNEGKKKSDAEAWEKEGQKFSAWELITGCWRSKQQTGAPNKLGEDFQMFSSEPEFFARSPAWTFCNYDDCAHKVGYPRDCGPAGQNTFAWHGFEGGIAPRVTNVEFHINTCNGWTPPVVELGGYGTFGWYAARLSLASGLHSSKSASDNRADRRRARKARCGSCRRRARTGRRRRGCGSSVGAAC